MDTIQPQDEHNHHLNVTYNESKSINPLYIILISIVLTLCIFTTFIYCFGRCKKRNMNDVEKEDAVSFEEEDVVSFEEALENCHANKLALQSMNERNEEIYGERMRLPTDPAFDEKVTPYKKLSNTVEMEVIDIDVDDIDDTEWVVEGRQIAQQMLIDVDNDNPELEVVELDVKDGEDTNTTHEIKQRLSE